MWDGGDCLFDPNAFALFGGVPEILEVMTEDVHETRYHELCSEEDRGADDGDCGSDGASISSTESDREIAAIVDRMGTDTHSYYHQC